MVKKQIMELDGELEKVEMGIYYMVTQGVP